jgi:hypothetical protein
MPGRQQRRGSEAYDRYVQFSQVPMTALAFLMIPVLLIPLARPVHGALAVSFDAADYVIWVLFAADYCVRFTLAPDRPRFVRAHLFDLTVVVLPFLPRSALCRSAARAGLATPRCQEVSPRIRSPAASRRSGRSCSCSACTAEQGRPSRT